MKTIIAATDFSPVAQNALNYSADMALALNKQLHLLYITNLPVTYGEIPIVMDEEGMKEAFETKLEEIKEDLFARTNGKLVITTQVGTGPFFEELKEVCENKRPFAIVLGSQGTSAAERFLLGSHAVHAMKHLPWPVITVPSGANYRSVKRIGLACDLEGNGHSLPKNEIEALVRDFGAEMHILNTGKPKKFNPNVVFESLRVEEMFKDLKPKVHFISSENTDESIMEFAEKNQIDLLVVMPLRHTLIDGLIHRSHTKQLVLHSQIPVMAVHP